MTDELPRVATCRGCGRVLLGRPYYMGQHFAHHPVTGERCPSNHYGGFVCSEACDRKVILSVEESMPGAGKHTRFPRELLNDWDNKEES